MLFLEQQPQTKVTVPQRIIYIYQNSAPQNKPIEIKLSQKKLTFKQLSKILNMNPLRLFNSQGAEYFQDDFQFIKNKTVLYASRGQDFDPASCFGEYQMIQKLGEGGFGKVFLAKHKQSQQKFAIKIIKTQKISSAAGIDSIFVQAQILTSLKHQNIVKVHNCLTLKNMQVAIIMEFLEGGQLLKLVQKQKKLSQETAKIFFKQIVKGMVYCHQNNLIHRDLKLENLLLVNGEQKKIKIIDFGIAGVVNFLTWEDMDTGSLAYMAPQCFINSKNYKVDGRIDVWATGVILYALLTGDLPFKGANTIQTVEAIKQAKLKIPWEVQKTLTPECIDILKQCLDPDSKTRPTMEQLLEHPWIAQKMITEQQIQKKQIKQMQVIQQQPIKIQTKKQVKSSIQQKKIIPSKPKYKK